MLTRFDKTNPLSAKDINLFGVFDGHGGNKCSNYLKDNLFNDMLARRDFGKNIEANIRESFVASDDSYLKLIDSAGVLQVDRSGSCAIVCMVIDKKVYFSNVGDSRAILSRRLGEAVIQCTEDHKPASSVESLRIMSHGGTIYRYSFFIRVANIRGEADPQMVIAVDRDEIGKLLSLNSEPNVLYAGPVRVRPGGLSVEKLHQVSRTFGDIEAKWPKYGGRSNVVICTPDIFVHDINSEDDFILLGSDGIFDVLTNQEIVQTVYNVVNHYQAENCMPTEGSHTLEEVLDEAIQAVMKKSLISKSEDNITIILIFFANFLDYLKKTLKISITN